MLLFDIVIPTYNNLDELKKCLSCFENQTIHSFHVWVCVDGSTDGTVDYLSQGSFSFPLSYLEHSDKKNHGRAATRNLVIPFVTAKYVIFLDSDLEVYDNFLENHFNVIHKDVNAISVGSLKLYGDNIWIYYVMSRGKNKNNNGYNKIIPYKHFESNNAAFPSKIFIQLKGFDENFKIYGAEDTELACQIWERYDSNFIYNKDAVAFGRMDKSLYIALVQREEFARTNLKYLIKKHPDAKTLFRVDVLQSLAGRILYSIIPLNFFMYLAQSSIIPKSIRIKIVHLLVFYHFYKGFHSKV